MAKKTPIVDPNTDDADDTQAAGDQSPRFQKLSAAEALALLTEVVDPALAALPDHALDTAAENSKIVVVNNPEGAGRIAVLATPDGAIRLPAGDRAHILPIGARVYKAAEGLFYVRMPDEYKYAEAKVGGRAAEVIEVTVTQMETLRNGAE